MARESGTSDPPTPDFNGQSQRLLKAIVENIPHMIFVKDATDLRFVLFNRAGEELLGVPRDRMLGKSDFDLFPVDQAELFVGHDHDVLSEGKLLDIPEEMIRSPTKGARKLHTKKVPILDDTGRPRYLLGISEDITERCAAENERQKLARQLEQSQKMEAIGRLAGGIAHDFNNLLMVILGEAELSLADLPPEHPTTESLEEIRKAGLRAAELTRQLLNFSRQGLAATSLVDANRLVADVEKILCRLIGEGVTLSSELCSGPAWVMIDRGQLVQVLLNLVVNARDAMPEGGPATIATALVTVDDQHARTMPGVRPGWHVLLTVSDSGIGMTDEVQSRIFEPFYTTKGPGRGTGLGLAICYGIVKGAGGHIAVDSAVGRGTVVRVYLPLAPAGDMGGNAAQEVESVCGGETILLVEDEDQVRRIGCRMLEGAGYRVVQARSGEEALTILADGTAPIDLLLTDVVMQGMNGSQLAALAQIQSPGLRVLYVTGYPGDILPQQGHGKTAARLIQKPFNQDTLLRHVRMALDGSER